LYRYLIASLIAIETATTSARMIGNLSEPRIGRVYREIPPRDEHTKICDGGSCIAGPDGRWLVEPVAREEA